MNFGLWVGYLREAHVDVEEYSLMIHVQQIVNLCLFILNFLYDASRLLRD